MKFSLSTGCFYPEWGQYDNLPTDLIEVTEEEFHAAINRPQNTRLIVMNGRVAIDPIPLPPLADRQEVAWEAIKAERVARKSGGIKLGDLWFHSDPFSLIQHLGLKDEARDMLEAGGNMTSQLILDGQPVPWKTMGGTWSPPLTVQMVLDIVAAGKVLDARLHKAAEIHNALMRNSPDPLAYDYRTGYWPERYGDAV